MLGPLQTQGLQSFGVGCSWTRSGDDIFASFDDPSASPGTQKKVVAKIRYITGSHHMQVYWYSLGPGLALAQVPFVFLVEENRWIPRSAAFLSPPRRTVDLEIGRWNITCIQCHTTLGRPRVERQEPTRNQSDMAELGISCEACHGPAKAHEDYYRNPIARYATHVGRSSAHGIVNPAKLDHKRSSQVCGQCHGILLPKTPELDEQINDAGIRFRPGDDLEETWYAFGSGAPMPDSVREYTEKIPRYYADRFWSDGMARVSGREYSGLAASPCFQEGEMSCLSCHDLHQDGHDNRTSKEWANDQLHVNRLSDAACTQCHEELKQAEAAAKHSRHGALSGGARCQNCHMPHTTYGLLKAIRSHQITSPSVMDTYQHGRMNACNNCHVDKTLEWTAVKLREWFGHEIPELTRDEKAISATVLAAIRGDAGQRALAAWSLGWDEARKASGSDWMAPVLAQLLDDPYYAVRFIAHRSLRTLPGLEHIEYDFMGDERHLADASRMAYQSWRLRAKDTPANPELLILKNGELDHDNFSRLLQQRDDSLIELRE